jgi:hypothetical protein
MNVVTLCQDGANLEGLDGEKRKEAAASFPDQEKKQNRLLQSANGERKILSQQLEPRSARNGPLGR